MLLGCDELGAGRKFAGLALVHLRGAACDGGRGVVRLVIAARSDSRTGEEVRGDFVLAQVHTHVVGAREQGRSRRVGRGRGSDLYHRTIDQRR